MAKERERRYRPSELVDVHEVAALLGLAHRNSVTTYLHRYPHMPRPVIDRSAGRTRLWVRADIERWNAARGRH